MLTMSRTSWAIAVIVVHCAVAVQSQCSDPTNGGCSSNTRSRVNMPSAGLTSLPSGSGGQGCQVSSSPNSWRGINLRGNAITGVVTRDHFTDYKAKTTNVNSPIMIDLSSNLLTGIGMDAFDSVTFSTSGSGSPVTIDLSNNRLRFLSVDAFDSILAKTSNSNSPITLNISNNQLTRIPLEAFEDIELTTTGSNSPITYDLRNNFITEIANGAFTESILCTANANSNILLDFRNNPTLHTIGEFGASGSGKELSMIRGSASSQTLVLFQGSPVSTILDSSNLEITMTNPGGFVLGTTSPLAGCSLSGSTLTCTSCASGTTRRDVLDDLVCVSNSPTAVPTDHPSTLSPTEVPTDAPTSQSPTETPTTAAPTSTAPTSAPITEMPTSVPTSGSPVASPITDTPTSAPVIGTAVPTSPSAAPTAAPTLTPATGTPVASPLTDTPTPAPAVGTAVPTPPLSVAPTAVPMVAPGTGTPSRLPTRPPTQLPTRPPTRLPTPRAPTSPQASGSPTLVPSVVVVSATASSGGGGGADGLLIAMVVVVLLTVVAALFVYKRRKGTGEGQRVPPPRKNAAIMNQMYVARPPQRLVPSGPPNNRPRAGRSLPPQPAAQNPRMPSVVGLNTALPVENEYLVPRPIIGNEYQAPGVIGNQPTRNEYQTLDAQGNEYQTPGSLVSDDGPQTVYLEPVALNPQYGVMDDTGAATEYHGFGTYAEPPLTV
eukprot:m.389719 g.389719  ORF g.389719 m.389719 type:complete len:715 (+) comp28295_c0_seq19:175-2319(+)